MAKIETVYLKGEKLKINMIAKSGGQVWIEIELPKNFADCIWKLAEAAINVKEQTMRAEILGDAPTNGAA